MEDPSVRLVQASELSPSSALANEDLSFEDFVLANQGRLFGSLCLVTGSQYEAEEIVQEAFVRLLEHWDRVRDMDDPVGYLFVTAMNVFRKRLRRLSLATRRSIHMAPSPDAFGEVEDREVVLGALARIPVEQRAAIVVTALFGYSSEEAGRILGVRASTVRARATRARNTLRELIGEDR